MYSSVGVDSIKNSDLECCVDFFSGTFHVKHLDVVFSLVSSFLGGLEFEKRNRGIQYFEESYIHPTGVLIGVGRKRSNLSLDCSVAFLKIEGSHLGSFSQSRVRKLIRVLLRKVNFSFSRLNIVVDDYKKRLDIEQIRRDVYKGYFTGRFQNKEVKYQTFGVGGSRGRQISFGKSLVIYDKELESRGKIKSIRVELNLCHSLAQQVAEHLASFPLDSWEKIMRSWICYSIDFVRRSGSDDEDPALCPRLSWWRFFAKGTSEIVSDISKKKVSYRRKN